MQQIQPVSTFSRVTLTYLPTFWFGLLVAISLIEAPLKFQAPGITIPLGLGIGRLVFGALNIVEVIIAIILLVATFRSGVPGRLRGLVTALAGVLLIKVALIRPFLNQRTDAVLAGVDDGGSSWHYLYIAADGLLLIGLVVVMVYTARLWLAKGHAVNN
ncbi:hypothetical protein [Micrococcoides hystricis]|uniref:Uncharacterized protein n=1 Tax=Micrococcoides hystricis TaxID=1572761 RepID=A0ABV6P8Z5_9MICC